MKNVQTKLQNENTVVWKHDAPNKLKAWIMSKSLFQASLLLTKRLIIPTVLVLLHQINNYFLPFIFCVVDEVEDSVDFGEVAADGGGGVTFGWGAGSAGGGGDVLSSLGTLLLPSTGIGPNPENNIW